MAEIKISELSIGDWVMYRDREWQVCSLYKFTEEVGLWRKDSQICEYVADIEPIPLTPEILEKNGFVRQDAESGIRYTLIEGNTMFGGTWAKSVFQWIFPMDFRFVHQLQHALRLAGVEKELEV